jgi:hypothetical protein
MRAVSKSENLLSVGGVTGEDQARRVEDRLARLTIANFGASRVDMP